MRCDIFTDLVAVWSTKNKGTNKRLSNLAAEMLVEQKLLQWSELHLIRVKEWMDFQGPGEPLTGAGGVLISSFQDAFQGLCSIPESTRRDLQVYRKQRRKRKGNSVADAVASSGHVAFAIRGTSAEVARKEAKQLDKQLNFRGEAAPRKRPFHVGRSSSMTRPDDATLRRTDTNSTIHHSVPTMVLIDVGKGLGEVSKAVFRLPSRLWWAGTLGMRNAPRLYGDKTVRPAPYHIVGFRSGCKIAGSEFYHGIHDGFTGLVLLPKLQIEEDGKSGLLLGIGKGIGGFVLKPLAGTMGLTAYPGKGFFISIRKRFRDTKRTERWIRGARMSQGIQELAELKMRSTNNQQQPSGKAPTDELEEAQSRLLALWSTRGPDGVPDTPVKP